jgi:hypothetical protein
MDQRRKTTALLQLKRSVIVFIREVGVEADAELTRVPTQDCPTSNRHKPCPGNVFREIRLGQPRLLGDVWIEIATDEREVDEDWLDQVTNDSPIRIERSELSHNAADSIQELIRVVLGLAPTKPDTNSR